MLIIPRHRPSEVLCLQHSELGKAPAHCPALEAASIHLSAHITAVRLMPTHPQGSQRENKNPTVHCVPIHCSEECTEPLCFMRFVCGHSPIFFQQLERAHSLGG